MSYDADKVDFTVEEHDMAAMLDNVIEQLANGIQLEDAAVILAAPVLFAFIASDGDRSLAASRLATLAIMLERDNQWINSTVA